jgi:hypothetical protein
MEGISSTVTAAVCTLPLPPCSRTKDDSPERLFSPFQLQQPFPPLQSPSCAHQWREKPTMLATLSFGEIEVCPRHPPSSAYPSPNLRLPLIHLNKVTRLHFTTYPQSGTQSHQITCYGTLSPWICTATPQQILTSACLPIWWY